MESVSFYSVLVTEPNINVHLPLVKHLDLFFATRMQNSDQMCEYCLPNAKFKLVKKVDDKNVIIVHLH
jgi:hypothetical protein